MTVLSESKVFAEYRKTPKSDRVYDFYRCFKCGRVLSRETEILRMEEDSMCPCGSTRYSPSWPRTIEWVRPDIAKYTVKLFLARGVAPWASEHNLDGLVSYIERLVRIG
jgi:DNA-directed RNA polymerase subunit RPC12/RpoP